jgi:hypothetical protein
MLRDEDPSGMGNEITFSGDSVRLDDRAREMLDEMLPLFNGKRNKIEIRSIALAPSALGTRPTKEDPPASDPWQASYERCQAVMSYLEKQGVEPSRIRLSQTTDVQRLNSADLGTTSEPRVQVYLLSEYADEYLDYSKHDERDEPFATPEQSASNETVLPQQPKQAVYDKRIGGPPPVESTPTEKIPTDAAPIEKSPDNPPARISIPAST